MVTMTLAVSPELKKRMDKFEHINWSAVARQAFEKQLTDLEVIRKITEHSTLTEKDALELGRMVNKSLFENHYKKYLTKS